MTEHTLCLQDQDGDRANLTSGAEHVLLTASTGGVYLDQNDAQQVVDFLQDWLDGDHAGPVKTVTFPRAEAPAHDCVLMDCDPGEACVIGCTAVGDHRHTGCEVPARSTIADEAMGAVYGDRQEDYGHPREDFTRQAIVWTGLLHDKLADGAYLEAEDIARCMIGTKLCRDVHMVKRDNRVDGVGYFVTLDRLVTGK